LFIGERTVYGWPVLTQLKADPELEKIHVFVISMVGDENKGYSLGPKNESQSLLISPKSKNIYLRKKNKCDSGSGGKR
jgi:hypothetical protein